MGLKGSKLHFDEHILGDSFSLPVLVLLSAEGKHGLLGDGCRYGWFPYTMSHLAENLATVQEHLK